MLATGSLEQILYKIRDSNDTYSWQSKQKWCPYKRRGAFSKPICAKERNGLCVPHSQALPRIFRCSEGRAWETRLYLATTAGIFPLCQFPLCQFPLRQFPFGQLPTLSIPILSIPIWSMLTKWELTKWELTKWEVDKVGIDEVGSWQSGNW